MKINTLGLLALSLLCVVMIALTGNYIFSLPADFFVLLSIWQRRRVNQQLLELEHKLNANKARIYAIRLTYCQWLLQKS